MILKKLGLATLAVAGLLAVASPQKASAQFVFSNLVVQETFVFSDGSTAIKNVGSLIPGSFASGFQPITINLAQFFTVNTPSISVGGPVGTTILSVDAAISYTVSKGSTAGITSAHAFPLPLSGTGTQGTDYQVIATESLTGDGGVFLGNLNANSNTVINFAAQNTVNVTKDLNLFTLDIEGGTGGTSIVLQGFDSNGVPEPGTYAMLAASSLSGLGLLARRRRNARKN